MNEISPLVRDMFQYSNCYGLNATKFGLWKMSTNNVMCFKTYHQVWGDIMSVTSPNNNNLLSYKYVFLSSFIQKRTKKKQTITNDYVFCVTIHAFHFSIPEFQRYYSVCKTPMLRLAALIDMPLHNK